jgi:sugar-specific transcriptional regulator TrmB
MNEEKALEYLGLTEKESAVYLSLLSLGKANVSDVSSHSKLKRPTTYLILEELRKKELVLKVPHVKKAIYYAVDPDAFFRTRMDNFKQAYSALPQLKARYKNEAKVSTLYFDGEQGIEDSLFYRQDELRDSEIVGFFAKGDKVSKKLVSASHKWREAMKKNNMTLRGIAPEHSTLEEFRKSDNFVNQTFKSIGLDEYSSDVSIEANDLFARIVLFDSQQAIIIESPAVVRMIKEIFQMVWKKIN